MKVLAIFVLLAISSVCYAAEYITPEQAKQAVWAFEGDRSIEFEEVDCFDCDSEMQKIMGVEVDPSYHLKEKNSDKSWFVNAVTGRLQSANYILYMMAEYTVDFENGLSVDKCRQIALDFAKKHYPEFDKLDLVLNEGKSSYDGYTFRWWERLSSGAVSTNGVRVVVRPDHGEIVDYHNWYRPKEEPVPVNITFAEAVEAAKAAEGIVIIHTLDNRSKRPYQDNGVVTWSFTMSGWDFKGRHQDVSCTIDANSGRVLEMAHSDCCMDEEMEPKPMNNLDNWVKGIYKSELKKTENGNYTLRLQEYEFTVIPQKAYILDAKGVQIPLEAPTEVYADGVYVHRNMMSEIAKHLDGNKG